MTAQDDRIALVQPRQFPDGRQMELMQTLNRHVPDMERGFVIQTRFGEVAVDSGQLADRIRDLVAQDARLQLMRLEVVELERAQGAAA